MDRQSSGWKARANNSRIPAMLPHIAFGAHPSGWMIGTTITRDAHGEYRWWHFGPLCFCWS